MLDTAEAAQFASMTAMPPSVIQTANKVVNPGASNMRIAAGMDAAGAPLISINLLATVGKLL